jgi:response regulator RpfG family c-di-GMP phosphodiesterase
LLKPTFQSNSLERNFLFFFQELILVRSQSSQTIETSVSETEKSKSSSDFIDHIRSLLSRDQSIPYITLSPPSTNISDSDFEKNLSQFMKLLIEQYIFKQEKVRNELENKHNYLLNFQQTQFNENKQLNQRCQEIQQKFQFLTEQYKQVKHFDFFFSYFNLIFKGMFSSNTFIIQC